MNKSKVSFSASCCFICKSDEDDELILGKFYSKWRIRVHYYCLLLTSNLVQNGETDETGICGFLQKDIRNEEARIRNQKCYVCKERYANISCCAKKCFRTFHTMCGIRNGCLSHFADTFQSWCDKHVELEDAVPHDASDVCSICYDVLGPYRKLESVRAPCCQNGWFHRRCVAQFAQSAGYFFKCPLCNSKDEFSRAMQLMGVYVPEKDAAWELEPNAFGEQLERPAECDADPCLCRFGRDYDNAKWDLRLCTTCGSTCRHDLCMEEPSKNYVCTLCRPIVGQETLAAVLALEAEERAKLDACSSPSDDDSRCGLNGARYESGIHSPGSSNSSSGASSSSVRMRAFRRNRSINTDSSDSDSSEISVPAGSKRKKRCIDSSDSSVDSMIVANKKRKSCHRRSVLPSESSDSDVVHRKKKSKAKSRLESSSNSSLSSLDREEIRLERLLKKIPLSDDGIDKLLNARLIVMLEKLSEEQIRTLTSEIDDGASTASSTAVFDFNYRMKLNKKQRRRSFAGLQSVKEAIRSDTETLTDCSGLDIIRTKTSASKSFSKRFKLKPLGLKSSAKKSVEPATAISDTQLPTEKVCPDMKSHPSSVPVFLPSDDENTCPNSPLKSSVEAQTETQQAPSSLKLKPLFSMFSPSPSTVTSNQQCTTITGGSTNGRTNERNYQTTLNSFFKKSPPSDENEKTVSPNVPNSSAITSADGSSGGGGDGISDKKKMVKTTPSSARKKLVEMDRSQRNLLDFFNRC
ncbi:dentin sialophosphoprotein-like [Toxorhynchites rutilus septentrionalis]|uniref:dentin sialophosphoprotein-like n=1 Tax=Toxorhynchites rutilus septentrionalis TaxID=329112 RepID=UPI00247B02D5|nr:dentin sialophosphoprotein-like [Toxorhynchites rutilus septentrionalis]